MKEQCNEPKVYTYRVRFLVKKGGERWYIVDLKAKDARAAKSAARAMWQGRFLARGGKPPHAFDMTARRRDTEGVEYERFTLEQAAE